MKRRNIILVLSLVALLLTAGCSSKGVRMPKHRKQRHCDCPTFTMAAAETQHDGRMPVGMGD